MIAGIPVLKSRVGELVLPENGDSAGRRFIGHREFANLAADSTVDRIHARRGHIHAAGIRPCNRQLRRCPYAVSK